MNCRVNTPSKLRWTGIVLFVALISAHCKIATKGGSRVASSDSSAPADEWWLNKALGNVWGAQERITPAVIQQYIGKPKSQVIDEILADKRFAEGASDFFMYFFGLRQTGGLYLESAPKTRIYHKMLYERPDVILATRAAFEGKSVVDALTTFDAPVAIGPLEINNNLLTSALKGQSSLAAAWQAAVSALGAAKGPDVCSVVVSSIKPILQVIQNTKSVRFSTKIDKRPVFNEFEVLDVVSSWTRRCSKDGDSLDEPIEGNNSPPPLADSNNFGPEFIKDAATIDQRMKEIFTIMSQLDQRTYVTSSVLDIRSLGSKISDALTSEGFWVGVPASKANRNRKRANYVLSHYFCENLTPAEIKVRIQPPALSNSAGQMTDQKSDSHNKIKNDAHLANPGCMACHYKLDPMGGFFRFRDVSGYDSEGVISLADGVVQGDTLKTYLEPWHDEAAYVRSMDDKSQNSYAAKGAEPMHELFRIIRESKEFKQCLSRRLVQAYLGVDQAIDETWLASISHQISSPVGGFKAAVKTILLSDAFNAEDRVLARCYDTSAPQGQGAGSAPCEVKAVIETNCLPCHDGKSRSGDLELSGWDKSANSFPFARFNKANSPQQYRACTFKAIKSALEEGAMPPSGGLTDQQKNTVISWLAPDAATCKEQ